MQEKPLVIQPFIGSGNGIAHFILILPYVHSLKSTNIIDMLLQDNPGTGIRWENGIKTDLYRHISLHVQRDTYSYRKARTEINCANLEQAVL